MQGVFIGARRPKSKKELKEAVAENPAKVALEATSWFGDEPHGRLTEIPPGNYFFVGPDPYSSRKFYGEIQVRRDGKVVVK